MKASVFLFILKGLVGGTQPTCSQEHLIQPRSAGRRVLLSGAIVASRMPRSANSGRLCGIQIGRRFLLFSVLRTHTYRLTSPSHVFSLTHGRHTQKGVILRLKIWPNPHLQNHKTAYTITVLLYHSPPPSFSLQVWMIIIQLRHSP